MDLEQAVEQTDVVLTEAPEPTPKTPETAEPSATADADNPGTEPQEDDADPDTFPRAYVQELRNENAKYRAQAKTADTLAERLHTELVRATGLLADPTDLEFDAARLDDPDSLVSACNDLLARKPHLKSRRVTGDVGQGATATGGGSVDLAGLLRSAAG